MTIEANSKNYPVLSPQASMIQLKLAKCLINIENIGKKVAI